MRLEEDLLFYAPEFDDNAGVSQGKTRIGILGAGTMAATHASAYATMPDVEVVGVFARDVDKARSIATICKAKAVPDTSALTESIGVDAIDVCLPTPIHAEFVLAALRHGKHVFCETPLALRLAEAHDMRDAARKANRLLQVGLLMRSIGAYDHLRAAVSSGEHGPMLSLSAWRLGSYLHPGAPDHKAHYSDPSTELMTFDFDVVNWLMGRPAHVLASAVGTASGRPGEISALLSFDDGRHATVVGSGLMPPGFPFTVGFRALFERAAFHLETVFADGPPHNTFTVSIDRAPPRLIEMPARNPYEVELRRFVDCIAGRADPALLDVDRAIEALDLSLATQRALAKGSPVRP